MIFAQLVNGVFENVNQDFDSILLVMFHCLWNIDNISQQHYSAYTLIFENKLSYGGGGGGQKSAEKVKVSRII